ncbi:Uncharacterized protein QTN25_003333 [Entamoeba marina]
MSTFVENPNLCHEVNDVEKRIHDRIQEAKRGSLYVARDCLRDLKIIVNANEGLLNGCDIDHSNDIQMVESYIEDLCLNELVGKVSNWERNLTECEHYEKNRYLYRLKCLFEQIEIEMNKVVDERFYNESFLTKKDVIVQKHPLVQKIYDKFDYYKYNIKDIENNINSYNEVERQQRVIKKELNDLIFNIEKERFNLAKEHFILIKNAYDQIVQLHNSVSDYLPIQNLFKEINENTIGDAMKYINDFNGVLLPTLENKSKLTLKKYAMLVKDILDDERHDLIFPHSKVAELARYGFMYSLTFKDQSIQEVINMKLMFEKVDQIISRNDYNIQTIDLITSAIGCVNILKNNAAHKDSNPLTFGRFCRIFNQLKDNGICVDSLKSDMRTIAKNVYNAPTFNYKDNCYDLSEQNIAKFIKMADTRRFNMGNLAVSIKNYYQYINCDPFLHENEFGSYYNQDNFDWMAEVSEEFNEETVREVKKIINSMDMDKDEKLNDLAHFGSTSDTKSKKLHQFMMNFEEIAQTLEMILINNGQKTFLQFPYVIKDFISVYNTLLCLVAATMVKYIRNIMKRHESCKVFDAWNTNLVITLQSIIKTLRPFTEKYASSSGLINKHIEDALKLIHMDIKKIKEQVPKLLNNKDLLSLSKALSLTTYIRMYYGYDVEAYELMNEVDRQCISTSNFGFIPNVFIFIKEVNPLFNQTPLTDHSISPTIFREKKPIEMNANIDEIDYSLVFNTAMLLRNAFITHSIHNLCLHKHQENDYSGVYITTDIKFSEKSNTYYYHNPSDFLGRHCDLRINLLTNKYHVLSDLMYFNMFMSNAVRPLYYRAFLICLYEICPLDVPGEFNDSLLLPLCKFNERDNITKIKFDKNYMETLNYVIKTRDEKGNKENFLAQNYHLGIEDEYIKQSKSVLEMFNNKNEFCV